MEEEKGKQRERVKKEKTCELLYFYREKMKCSFFFFTEDNQRKKTELKREKNGGHSQKRQVRSVFLSFCSCFNAEEKERKRRREESFFFSLYYRAPPPPLPPSPPPPPSSPSPSSSSSPRSIASLRVLYDEHDSHRSPSTWNGTTLSAEQSLHATCTRQRRYSSGIAVAATSASRRRQRAPKSA